MKKVQLLTMITVIASALSCSSEAQRERDCTCPFLSLNYSDEEDATTIIEVPHGYLYFDTIVKFGLKTKKEIIEKVRRERRYFDPNNASEFSLMYETNKNILCSEYSLICKNKTVHDTTLISEALKMLGEFKTLVEEYMENVPSPSRTSSPPSGSVRIAFAFPSPEILFSRVKISSVRKGKTIFEQGGIRDGKASYCCLEPGKYELEVYSSDNSNRRSGQIQVSDNLEYKVEWN